ncbi:MAG: GlsB/YeaQ/YmgE family stress response membrane protein [Burkholderiales bacterium]
MELVWFLIIGLIAGWLAGQFVKGGGYGLVGDLIVGVAGAFIGGFLFRALGLSAYGLIGNLVVATVGAVVLLVVLRAVKRAK